jgi:hypothetical protein
MYPEMSVELLLLIRDDTFRLIRKLINDPLCKCTLDSVLLEVSDRFEEILLGYALKLPYPGSGTTAKILSSAFSRRVGTTRPTTAPPFRLTETVSFVGSLRPSTTSWRRRISVSTASVTKRPPSRKKNAALLTENDELLRHVPSADSGSKRGQDDFRVRSDSRGRPERSHSREPSSGHHFGGSKKRSFKKKVNYDSDR